MRSLCLDTNTYTALLAKLPDALAIIAAADLVWIPVPVLGELRAGFLKGRKAADNELTLQEFLSSDSVHVAQIDEPVTIYYAKVFEQLRKIGRPIPSNDLWIAACALKLGCPLYSLDKHFDAVGGLVCIKRKADWHSLP